MTGTVIHTVFVSSTYEDLREERAEVQKALLKLDAFPVGMELFPSADEETWDFIESKILESDYYMVIIAGKYGSEANDGISFTEKEYDYARRVKKPVIAFVHENLGKLPREKTETDPIRYRKLLDFLSKVKKSPVRRFGSSHELAAEVVASYVDVRLRHPAVGFIRTDQTVEIKKYAEVLEKNARLNDQLRTLRTQLNHEFRGFDETVKIQIWRNREVGWVTREGKLGRKNERQSEDVTLRWDEIFYIFASSILFGDKNKEAIIRNLFVRHYGIIADSCEITQADFDTIVRKLVARQLIDIEGDAVSRRFSLLDFGRKQFDLISDRFEGVHVKSEVLENRDASFVYEDIRLREPTDL